MADLIPAPAVTPARPLGLLAPLRDPQSGRTLDRLRAAAAQPPPRKASPWFAGASAFGLLALTWAVLAPEPQRVLYSSLGDAERAGVVAALEKASIGYTIDTATGAI